MKSILPKLLHLLTLWVATHSDRLTEQFKKKALNRYLEAVEGVATHAHNGFKDCKSLPPYYYAVTDALRNAVVRRGDTHAQQWSAFFTSVRSTIRDAARWHQSELNYLQGHLDEARLALDTARKARTEFELENAALKQAVAYLQLDVAELITEKLNSQNASKQPPVVGSDTLKEGEES